MKTILLAALAVLVPLGAAQAFKEASVHLHEKYCFAGAGIACPVSADSVVNAPCACYGPHGFYYPGFVQVKPLKTRR
jgi:hypothetical protein